jgi:arylsulfatase A
MMKKLKNLIVVIILATAGCVSHAKEETSKNQPNVVIIFADDMGYGDVTANNPESKLKTPNLDKLASQGINFTDAHTSSAVCTPSRYSLMTGRYPWRSPKKRGVLNGYSKPLIELGRQTLGSIFQDAGYTTSIIGKWHLGVNWQTKEAGQIANFGTVDYTKPVLHTPKQLGFDYSYIFSASLDFSPAVFIENNTAMGPVDEVVEFIDFPAFSRKTETIKGFKHEDVLDHLKDKAVKYIQENSENEKPFFLYFPITAPHKPLIPHPRFRGTSEAAWYGDFIQQVDWTVGEVLNALEKEGLAENTIVLYSSDNGSYMYQHKNGEPDHMDDLTIQGFKPENHKANWNWRGTKADIYEAGHRVPFMVRWPNKLKAKTISETVCLTDVAATLVDLLDLKADSTQMEDSYSMVPLLTGEEEFIRKPVIHQSGGGALAIRKGDYKLILCSGSGGREKPRGKTFGQPYQLYNLAIDPFETNNIYLEKEEIAQALENEFFEIAGNDITEKDFKGLKK